MIQLHLYGRLNKGSEKPCLLNYTEEEQIQTIFDLLDGYGLPNKKLRIDALELAVRSGKLYLPHKTVCNYYGGLKWLNT